MQPKTRNPLPVSPGGPAKPGRRVRLALFAAGLLLVVGCGTSATVPSSTPADRPLADQVVTVACPTGPRGEAPRSLLQRFSGGWSARTGARVEIVRYDAAAGPAAGPPADVWVLPPAEMPHWAAAGALREIPNDLKKDPAYNWDGLLPLYTRVLLVWGQARPPEKSPPAYALPLLGDTPLCFYRRDLFLDAGEQAGYRQYRQAHQLPPHDLAAPVTWEEFAELAAYFHNKPRPGVNHPCPSLPPLPADDDGVDQEFYAIAASFARRAIWEDEKPRPSDETVYAFHYNLDGTQPHINGAGFVHALDLLRRMQAYRPAGTAADPEKAFADGEAVFCLANPAAIHRFDRSRVRGKFGFCRVPGSAEYFAYPSSQPRPAGRTGNRVPYLGAGGWLAVVPRTASRPDAAFDLLKDLSGPETSRNIVLEPAWGGSGFRHEHLADQRGWNAFGLSQEETVSLRQALQDTLNRALLDPAVRLRIPDEREHLRAVVKAVRLSVTGPAAPQDALNEAVQAWNALDKGKSPQQRRHDYRSSLGLVAGP